MRDATHRMAGHLRPNLFVYGTLKRGGRYHAAYFPERPPGRSARTRGRLFALPAGYPALSIAESLILSESSGNEAADREAELGWRSKLTAWYGSPAADGAAWVHGELIALPDYGRLRALDELEEFRPGQPSLFLRVLAPVWTEPASAPVPAWVYIQPEPRGIVLPAGRWTE